MGFVDSQSLCTVVLEDLVAFKIIHAEISIRWKDIIPRCESNRRTELNRVEALTYIESAHPLTAVSCSMSPLGLRPLIH